MLGLKERKQKTLEVIESVYCKRINFSLRYTERLQSGERSNNGMKKIQFYLCPSCGTLLTATAPCELRCCGKKLDPLAVQEADERHRIEVEEMDGDYYVRLNHEMSKNHYIQFVAFVSNDRVLLIELYPEQEDAVRFPKWAKGDLYVGCNRHGLYRITL